MSREPKRIALLSQNFAEYASLLACSLGIHNEVLLVLNEDDACATLEPDWKSRFNSSSVQVLALPKARSLTAVLSNFRLVRTALRNFDPEIIHCQEGGMWDELLLLIVFCRACPLVLTVHDPSPHGGDDSESIRFSRHRFYHWLVRKMAAAVIVHGERLRAELCRTDSAMCARSYVVPHGVLGAEGEAFNTAWEAGNILFFGRMNHYKGLSVFIEASKKLAERDVRVRAIVAGRGPDLDRHRKDLSDATLFDVRDRFITRNELKELFRQSNVVVLPYLNGTQSGVGAMALGHGRPIVATRVGAIPELVSDGENGILVEPGDADALADALERVVRNAEASAGMARHSWDLGRGLLSWQQIGKLTSDVYRSAMLTPPRFARLRHRAKKQRSGV